MYYLRNNKILKTKDIKTMKILVVEDQPELVDLIRAMLEEVGVHHIIIANDGASAMKVMAESTQRIDLVLCDWNMPQMNGIDLLRHIRCANSNLPFVMMSGRTDIASVLAARDSGVSAYLQKPFTPEQLETKLEKATLSAAG